MMKINRLIPSRITDRELKNENVIYPLYTFLKNVLSNIDKVYRFRYSTRVERWFPPKLISKKYRFIYVINPVTGTRSIIKNIIKNPEHEYGASFERTKMCGIKNAEEYKMFTTVRNPLKRLVSAWRKQVLNASTVRKIGLISQYDNIYPRMEFGKFVAEVCRGEMDSHWAPQCDILRENGEQINIDRYISTESLDEEYESFCKKNGIPYSNLPYVASSKSLPIQGRYTRNGKYISNLSSKLKSKLRKTYNEDAKKFGYVIDKSLR